MQALDLESMAAAQGVCRSEIHNFFYFYYYLGLLPVTADLHLDHFSVEDARDITVKHGAALANDTNSACAVGRLGDWGRIFLYLPKAWMTERAAQPSVIVATSLIFMMGLVAILAASFAHRRFLLGLALVVFVGSYKKQLLWAYFADNIQGLLISTTLLLLALNFRFVCQRYVAPLKIDWIVATLSAALICFIRTARGDVLPLAASILCVYLLSGQRWFRRLALSAVFVFTLVLVSKSLDAYFDYKSRQSRAFITSVGGKIFAGEPNLYHSFWHPIAAGLGDYGMDRGFAWDDVATYQLALPKVNQRMDRHFVVDHYFFVEPSMAPEQWLKPETLREYDETLRDIVVTTVQEHPKWYLDILVKRVAALLASMDHIRVGWASGEVSMPFSPWLILVMALLSVILRRFDYLKLLLFVAPTAFVPVFIYSGYGTVFLSVIHLIVGAVLLEASIVIVFSLYKKLGSPTLWRWTRSHKGMEDLMTS